MAAAFLLLGTVVRARAGVLLAALFTFCVPAQASSDAEIAAIVARPSPPQGVVFEVVSWNRDALRWAVPALTRYTEQLRKRFPGLPIAVVTHGNEMFSLSDDARVSHAPVHAGIEQLLVKDKVPVHVCGTYAEMRGTSLDAFPKYVDVAPSGPAQLRAYRELGYTQVLLTRN